MVGEYLAYIAELSKNSRSNWSPRLKAITGTSTWSGGSSRRKVGPRAHPGKPMLNNVARSLVSLVRGSGIRKDYNVDDSHGATPPTWARIDARHASVCRAFASPAAHCWSGCFAVLGRDWEGPVRHCPPGPTHRRWRGQCFSLPHALRGPAQCLIDLRTSSAHSVSWSCWPASLAERGDQENCQTGPQFKGLLAPLRPPARPNHSEPSPTHARTPTVALPAHSLAPLSVHQPPTLSLCTRLLPGSPIQSGVSLDTPLLTAPTRCKAPWQLLAVTLSHAWVPAPASGPTFPLPPRHALTSVLSPSCLSNFQAMDNISNEIEVMKKVKHPHCIPLYNVYESANHIYIVMELVCVRGECERESSRVGGQVRARASSTKSIDVWYNNGYY